MGQSGTNSWLNIMPDNPEIWKAAAMADHFDKIQKLPDPVVGAPNFHRIPGYKVYSTGQPTIAGVKNVLEKVTGKIYPKEGKLKYVDINKTELSVEVKELKSLSEVMEEAKADFPGLVHMRVPICNSASPLETDFDIICATLVGSSINTPVIVNDQVGLSRATTGCVIACLFKEFQINASFEGLVETVPGMNLDLLK